jgi:hypothetical protein
MNEEKMYLTAKQIAECSKYPFTIGQIRHLLLFRHKNGLEHAVRKVGRTILIRQDLFEAWLESHAKKKTTTNT